MKQVAFEPTAYQIEFESLLIEFLKQCLPESGRCLDINGRHSYYKNITKHFKGFWCLFDEYKMIGTVAVSELDKTSCELKSLYLLEQYHGMGYGKNCLFTRSKAQERTDTKKYIWILYQQVKKHWLYIAKQDLLIRKNIIRAYIQIFLWF